MVESTIVVRPPEPISLTDSLTAAVTWADAGQTLTIETGRVVIAAAAAAAMSTRLTPLTGEWIEVVGWAIQATTLNATETIALLLRNPDGEVVESYMSEAFVNGAIHAGGDIETGRTHLPIYVPAGFDLDFRSNLISVNDNIEIGVQGIRHISSL